MHECDGLGVKEGEADELAAVLLADAEVLRVTVGVAEPDVVDDTEGLRVAVAVTDVDTEELGGTELLSVMLAVRLTYDTTYVADWF